MIYISSGGAVYGEPVRLPCDEGHPIAPLCPYGASKYAMEVYLKVYRATYGLETTVLRYANVYGPRQDPHGEAGVVAIFAGRMLRADPAAPPRINGDGEQTRDFVYVGDCARANVLALDGGDGGVYNIGTGAETSINELASKLVAATGYTGEVTHGPANAGEVIRIYSAVARAREGLGFEAAVPLAEGLAKTVAFFAEQTGVAVTISLDAVFCHDENIVDRNIAGEVILVPIRNNVGDLESIYTLNETAARIWELLDGVRTLGEVRDAMVGEYEVGAADAEGDLLEVVGQLVEAEAVREAGG